MSSAPLLDPEVVARAARLHRDSPVTDLHADTFLAVRYTGCDIRERHRPPRGWNPLRTHCDLPRLREGGVRCQGFGVVIPPFVRRGARFEHARGTIALMRRTFRAARDLVALARTPAEAAAVWGSGRLAAFVGVEGGHALDGEPARVDVLRGWGVTYLGLCHFGTNDIVVASGERRPPYRGLGPIGREVIARANRCGLVVDLAHCHEASFFSAIDASAAPAVVTHGACRGLADHHRNLSDAQLQALAAAGGVMGIIFYPWYLGPHALRAGIDRIVDHVDHVAQLVGPEHVALGSDFDGFVWTVQGLPDVAALPRLTEALVARGYPDAAVRGILGENWHRVWRRVVELGAPV